jgi:hypothetical protein
VNIEKSSEPDFDQNFRNSQDYQNMNGAVNCRRVGAGFARPGAISYCPVLPHFPKFVSHIWGVFNTPLQNTHLIHSGNPANSENSGSDKMQTNSLQSLKIGDTK